MEVIADIARELGYLLFGAAALVSAIVALIKIKRKRADGASQSEQHAHQK